MHFLTAAFVVAVVLTLSSAAEGQPRKWDTFRNRKVIAFDWNCAQTKLFPTAAINTIVYRSLNPNDRGRAWRDRAFTLPLQPPGRTIYFVPTICGATGNCTWRIYTLSPVRYRGEIGGQFIYTYKAGNWPTIVTYTRMGSSEGVLATYVPHRGRYRRLRDEYPIGLELKLEGVRGLRGDGHKMPSFFENAVRQCENFGG